MTATLSRKSQLGHAGVPPRWFPPNWKRHQTQIAFFNCSKPRQIVPAGRGGGKTAVATRKLMNEAYNTPDGVFIASAPTHLQAKRLFWRPLLSLIHSREHVADISYSELMIELINGARVMVTGMDRPERIEGLEYVSGILMDEYANMRAETWLEHVQPMISRYGHEGFAWFTGVPEGRNHYWDLYCKAQEDDTNDWAIFKWPSADILDPKEIERARREMDERTFNQEYNADFVDFRGRAYYNFDPELHARRADITTYDPQRELIFCFDFNKEPGCAAVLQEKPEGTAVLAEVWKETDSNTEIISRRLVEAWRHHPGRVKCYGDASGGARKSSAVHGSDWDIIRSVLKHSNAFGDRCLVLHKQANPPIAVRVNSVNKRLRDVDGNIRLWVDPVKAPHLVRDFEGVTWEDLKDKDTTKRKSPTLTHLSDAVGYYCEQHFGESRAFVV